MAAESSTVWDANLYLKFADHRMRPALDLMGRLDPANGARPGHAIYDLGCGAGNISRILAERFPQSPIVGINSSEEMLENLAGPAQVSEGLVIAAQALRHGLHEHGAIDARAFEPRREVGGTELAGERAETRREPSIVAALRIPVVLVGIDAHRESPIDVAGL